MHKISILLLLAVSVAYGRILDKEQHADASQKLSCSQNAYFTCMLTKAVVALRQAKDVDVVDGITLVRDAPVESMGRSLQVSEGRIMSELPQGILESTFKLLGMLYDSGVSFFESHSLRLDEKNTRSLEDARTKIKKFWLPLIALFGAKLFTVGPILLGGLTLATIKAYIISKLALLVSAILAFQRFFGSDAVSSTTPYNKNQYSNWFENNAAPNWLPNNTQNPYKRSVVENVNANANAKANANANTDFDAHNLAYSAHEPVYRGN